MKSLPGLFASRLNGVKNYAVNACGDIVVTAMGFASSILIARGLGPEGRGQLAAALLWPTTMAALIALGLPHAFAYAVGAQWAAPRRLARFGAIFALGVGLPAAAIYFLVAPRVLSQAFPKVSLAVSAFACFIPLTLCAGLWAALFQGRGDFVTWNLAKLLRSIGYTIWIAVALYLGGATVAVMLWSQVVLVVLVLVLLGTRMSGFPAEDPADVVPATRLFRYGLTVYASGIFYMLNQQLDQLLLSLWVPAEELGQYAAAASLSAIVLIAPSALGPVVFSRLASAPYWEGRSHALKALMLGVAILLPAGIMLTVLAPYLIPLIYGKAFAPAGQVLQVLAPATIFLGLTNLMADILRGSGRPFVPTLAMLVGLMVTVPGLLLALPAYGIWGAAWVSFAAYATMLAVESFGFFFSSNTPGDRA
jgi:O-antigen/teichoic acid export membrane protein